jgi:ubiquinone/menaquinone biosynthesis C-methylase UbiE
MSDAYHLAELKIALDRSHPAHELPPPMPPSARVLDVGCGAGQTLIAAYPNSTSFGIDVDFDALRLGRTLTQSVAFACGQAEALPYASEQFDLVAARVSLAYTDISRSLSEIHRVLRPEGMVWMTLHPLSLCWDQARGANWKGLLYFLYVLANGICFHMVQKQFSLGGKQESFQTEAGITRALRRAGFHDIRIHRERSFLVTARR